MEQVRKQDELVAKAKAGQLVEKPQKKAPAPSENLRKFNVFVDGDYFEVGVDAVGGAPMVNSVRPMAPVAASGPGCSCRPGPAAPAPAPSAPKVEAARHRPTLRAPP